MLPSRFSYLKKKTVPGIFQIFASPFPGYAGLIFSGAYIATNTMSTKARVAEAPGPRSQHHARRPGRCPPVTMRCPSPRSSGCGRRLLLRTRNSSAALFPTLPLSSDFNGAGLNEDDLGADLVRIPVVELFCPEHARPASGVRSRTTYPICASSAIASPPRAPLAGHGGASACIRRARPLLLLRHPIHRILSHVGIPVRA